MDKIKEDLARNAPQFLREHEKELSHKQNEDNKLANVSFGMEKLKQDLAKKAPECVPLFEAAYRSLRAEEENESDKNAMAKRLGGKNRHWKSEAKLSDFPIAVAAVKAGWCNGHSAYLAFKVPVKLLYNAIKEGRFTPFPSPESRPSKKKPKARDSTGNQKETTKRSVSKRLSKEDDNAVKDYALALYKIGFPPTYEAFLPLAEKFYKKANSGIKSPDGFAFMFVKRHPDLYGKYLKRTQEHIPTQELTAQLFDRLNYLYETYGFATKPARIYACDALPFEAERWGADKTTLVDVEILVAANAIGYHILTPCIVYADEDEIPDFLGLPEAGFVLSSEKKVTAPILAEWFSSVFVQYLPSRSADDPILLLIDAKADWFSPELLEAAEKEHVHLVPICQRMRFAVNPIVNILLKLRSAYKDALDDYKRTRIAHHFDENESQDDYFPVLLFDLFSDHFSMKQLQKEFKATGVYPLKPDIHLGEKRPSGSSENLPSTTAEKDTKKAVTSDKNAPRSTDGETTKIASNTVPKSDGGRMTTVHNEDKHAVSDLINCTKKTATQTESTSGSTSSSLNDRLSRISREDEPIITASMEELLGVPNTIPKEKPTIIVAKDPLRKTAALTTSSVDESSNVVEKLECKESLSEGQKPPVKKFDLCEMDSIVVVKNQNEDRRIYVKSKKNASTPALKLTKAQQSAIAATQSTEFIVYTSDSPSTSMVLKPLPPSNATAAVARKDTSETTISSKSNRQGKTGAPFQPRIMTKPTSTVGGRTTQHAANSATSAATSKVTVVDVARGSNKSALRKSPRKQVVVAREVLHGDGVDNVYDRRMSHRPAILGSRKRKLGGRKPPLVVTLDDLVVDKRPKGDLSVRGKRKKTEGASPSRKKTRSMKR